MKLSGGDQRLAADPSRDRTRNEYFLPFFTCTGLSFLPNRPFNDVTSFFHARQLPLPILNWTSQLDPVSVPDRAHRTVNSLPGGPEVMITGTLTKAIMPLPTCTSQKYRKVPAENVRVYMKGVL